MSSSVHTRRVGWDEEGGWVLFKSVLNLIPLYVGNKNNHAPDALFLGGGGSGVRTLAGGDCIKDVEIGVAVW